MLPKTWKLICYFCAGTLCALCLVWLFIPANPSEPTGQGELYLREQARIQEAHMTEVMPKSSPGAIQAMPATWVGQALAQGDYGAAFAMAKSAAQPGLRDELLAEIAASALRDCASLHLAGDAINAISSQEIARSLGHALGRKRQACGQAAQ